jgi:ribosomal protein L40E
MDDKLENEEPLNAAEWFSRDATKMAFENASSDAEIDNLRSEIQSLNSEIAELKNRIGEYYWQAFVASGQHESALKDVFNGILSRADEITVLEQDIQTAQDGADQPIQPPIQLLMAQVACKSCGTMNDAPAKFCSSCGIALEEEPKGKEISEYHVEDYGICPLCGANLQDDAIFCYTCGARVKI